MAFDTKAGLETIAIAGTAATFALVFNYLYQGGWLGEDLTSFIGGGK